MSEQGQTVEPAATSVDSESTIGRLPVELLNESFSYLNPIDLLAVTRSCKALCHILVDPHSSFVWKRARHNFNVDTPVPDPTPNWTEPALANFLFSAKRCATCQRSIHDPPISLACRVVLCRKKQCIDRWMTSYTKPLSQFSRLHHNFLRVMPFLDLPRDIKAVDINEPRYLASDCLLEQARYDEMVALESNNERRQAYVKELEKRFKQSKRVMEWASETQKWAETYSKKRIDAVNTTKSNVMSYASDQGWGLYEVQFSPTLLSLRRRCERELEALPIPRIRAHRNEIARDLRKAVIDAEPRKKKLSDKFRKTEIDRLYSRIKGREIIPSKAEFGRLTTIQTLQRLDKEAIERLLESDAIMDMLNSDLLTWVKTSLDGFGKQLGCQRWISISTKMFHPAERANAYFQCRKCHHVPPHCAILRALPFREASHHICKGLSAVKRAKAEWNPDMFEVDNKAVAAANNALAVAGCDPTFFSMKKFEALGHLFICKSCPSLIVMNFASVIGHCKRHEEMQVELVLPGTEDGIVPHPIKYGLFDKLNKVPGADKGLYGCRHCGQDSKGKFVLNGLISHLKAKHAVLDVRDEDFFQVKGPPM